MPEENIPQASPTEPALQSAPIATGLPEQGSSTDPLAILKANIPVLNSLIPQGVPPSINANENVQGTYRTGPDPGAKKAGATGNTTNYALAIRDMMQDPNWSQDKYKYGRTYSYGAGSKNMNFDRYYQHPKFKELGFSPYRDNETHYNENSSWWDDFGRMRGQWAGLAWGGAKSVWGDEKEAHENMEKGLSIGSSTRGGAGGWVTNFGINSAYTVGIMGELIVEDAALAAIEVGSFGTATPEVAYLAATRNAMGIGKIAQALKGTYNFIKELKNVDKAKDFFSAAKAWDTTKDIAKWANPLSRSMETATHLINNTHGFNNLKTSAKISKSFGNFYRDLRELNVAHSEAKLEGEGAASEFQDNMIDKFYAENGRMPEGDEAKRIFDTAQSLKASVIGANDLTIYFTNKLAFEDLFEGIRPGAQLAKAFTEVGTEGFLKVAGKAFKKGTATVAGNALLQEGKRTGAQKLANFLTKSPYLPWSRKYMLGNVGEALQENAQEVITQGYSNYYDKIYSDPVSAVHASVLSEIGKGISDQFSVKGLDTFAQGYLMGSLIQGGGAAIKNSKNLGVRGTKAAAFQFGPKDEKGNAKYGQEWNSETEADRVKNQRQENTNQVMNAGNTIADNALTYGAGDERSSFAAAIKLTNQEKKNRLAAGDTLGAHDMGDETQINHFEILAKTGNMKLITDHVDDMLSLEDKDLADAYELDEAQAGDARKKLQTLKSRAETYQARYDKAKKVNPNPHNPWMFDPKKYKDAYEDEYIKYMAHEQAVSDILFATEDFDRMGERMVGIANKLAGTDSAYQNILNTSRGGIPMANVTAVDLTALIDPLQATETQTSLENQIAAMKLGTPEQKAKAGQLEEQLEFLKTWQGDVDNYLLNLDSEHKSNISEEERMLRKERARMLPGATVVSKYDGETYTIEADSKGNLFINKNGKLKKFNKDNYSVSKDAAGVSPEYLQVEGDELNSSIARLHDTFKKYLQNVAKINKGYTFDDQLNEAFIDIKDFLHLGRNQMRVVNTINTLSNPDMFEYYKGIQYEVQKMRRAQKLEKLNEAMATFEKMKDDNKMLNEIFDQKAFVLPEDIDRLKEFNVVDFYDASSNNRELIKPDSEKYKTLLEIVEKYARLANKTTKGKEIKEAGTSAEAREMSKYNASSRKKYERDKRTYEDHAKEFGFDPTADKSSVPAHDVLRAIINGKYSTPREKALARRMLTVVNAATKVSFVNNHPTPGSYNGATDETVVDARYSADDYRQGEKGHPIEHVILHELVHQVTVKGLTSDPKFRADMEKLLAEAKNYLRTPEAEQQFGSKPLYGTMNVEEFVAEAMSNDTFQAMLSNIPYAATGKSLWEEFTDTVKRFLTKVFGPRVDSSLLDEAMYLITNKLEADIAGPAASTTGATGGTATTTITRSTPISIIQKDALGLFEKLAADYRAYYKINKGGTLGLTDDELVDSQEFEDYVQTSDRAGKIIDAYNGGKPATTTTTTKTTVKKTTAPANKWSAGKQYSFTGTVQRKDGTSIDLTKVNMEVVEDQGASVDPDTGIAERIIVLKDLTTGEEYIIDLGSTAGKAVVVEDIAAGPVTNPHFEKWSNIIKNAVSAKELYKITQQIDATTEGMSPDLMDLITMRRAELPQIDEPVTDNLFELYDEIKSGQKLEEFMDKAREVLATGTIAQKNYYASVFNQAFDSVLLDKLEKDKKTQLANEFEFTDLIPDTIVRLNNGFTSMIVGKMEGNTVYLLTPQDRQTNNMTNALKVTPDDFKKEIKYIEGDFVADVTTTPDITDAEKADVESEAKAFKDKIDPAEALALAKKFAEMPADERKKDISNKFKSCKL